MAESAQPSLDEVVASLTLSHERLVTTVESLADEQLDQPSYDADWTIAQVLSHIGSGAEIFRSVVAAGAAGKPAPGEDEYESVWSRWNALSPRDQARGAVEADAAFLAALAALPLADRDAWRLDFEGGEKTLAELARIRLGEHAVHTWDVVVAVEPEATVSADAVALLVDQLDGLAAGTGRPGRVTRVRVETVRPERYLVLESSADGVTLTPAAPDDTSDADAGHPDKAGEAVVRLPAEALLRLVYGRLDADHTPPGVACSGVELDDLRATFPGL